ncbi:MAG: hypothetical protein PHR28_00680, partial [candidate division Zixibacteria bacterium]|nr:hypothetical protein [candidate division Zixibacteria bacterium]
MMVTGLFNFILLATEQVAGAVDTTGAAGTHESGVPHIPTFLTFISKSFAEHYGILFFALFTALLLVIVATLAVRKKAMIPGA